MLWKLLSGLAAVMLGTAVFFAYTANKDSIKNEKAKLAQDKEYVKQAKDRVVAMRQEKEKKDKDLIDKKKEQVDAGAELNRIRENIKAKEGERDGMKTQFQEITDQLAKVEKQIQDAGDVQTLIATISGLEKQQKEGEAGIANQMQQKSIAEEKVGAIKKDIAARQEVDRREKEGIVEPGLTARISQAYPNMGFVVLNKGVSNGVFARAALDVRRGKQVVAKLMVRDVESNKAVADVVPGSSRGNTVQAGDLVVASAEQPKLKEEQAAGLTTPAGGKPGAPALPGAPAVPGAPATPGAPGAPAAPAMADPFGSTPAPAPAAATPPAGAADPFGATPAPAPATPPPAAGGAGTPTNPSTADPFAPAGGAPPAATPPASTMDPFAPKPPK